MRIIDVEHMAENLPSVTSHSCPKSATGIGFTGMFLPHLHILSNAQIKCLCEILLWCLQKFVLNIKNGMIMRKKMY